MDIGSAFTFVFDDEEWIKKVAIGGGITFVALLLSPILIGLVLFLPLSGYMIEVLKNVRDGQPKPLPEWSDFGGLFKTGLFVAIITIVYNIPSLFFVCVTQGITIGMSEADSDIAQALSFVVICSSCLQILFSLLATVLLPAGLIRYAQTDSLAAAFQFGEIFNFIKNNIGDYLIAVILAIVAQVVAFFLGLVLCVIGILFTFFWSLLVTGNLYGQLARKAQVSM
jgi:hypothetical protein